MPIIGKVGRKSTKLRMLNISIHIVLILGAITMIYPFMMMVSASFKSNVDSINFSLYPEYFVKEEVLFKKYVEARYNEESNQMIENYKNKFLSFDQLHIPSQKTQMIYDDWQEFLKENSSKHNNFDYYISEQFGRGVYPRNERFFRNVMKEESNKSIEDFNRKYNASIESWEEVRIEEREILSRNYIGDYNGFLKPYQQLRKALPLWHRSYVTIDGNFVKNELIPAYRNNLRDMNSELGTDYESWDKVYVKQEMDLGPMKKHWVNYVKHQLNLQQLQIKQEASGAYRDFLQKRYDKIVLLNETYGTNYQAFAQIRIPEHMPRSGAEFVDLTFFVERIADPENLMIKGVELDYRNWLKNKYQSIDRLNETYRKGFDTFAEVELTRGYPEQSLTHQQDWTDFLRNEVPEEKLRILAVSQTEFLDFLSLRFPGDDNGMDLQLVNRITGKNYKKVLNIYPPKLMPENEQARELWRAFVKNYVSGRFLEVDPDGLSDSWQKYLENKYQTIENLNNEWGIVYNDFAEVNVDNWAIDYEIFKAHHKEIFWEFVKRNYVMVLDLMLYNGRAVVNTLIYCFLAIITALIVNPLAAYAMSRFKLKATYKILLILMLTMAFPPMVMGIPSFLLLKKFNMLNTFFALILPAAADGYFIFLLKGFFDSLPKELFESATIDGAGEVRIFWQIAMSLSKPIMAVIALGAFNAAYRNFMFAFIVCQDKSMWTMMVHIYQLIQRSCPGVGFAALVIAAVPTFAVFVFFQNIIIRGIVVPTEK